MKIMKKVPIGYYELVTVNQAQAWLAHKVKNRPVYTSVVNEYKRHMMSGNWTDKTAEPIKIAKSGKLLDGQHRLTALIQSGLKSLWLPVARDLEEDVFDVLDSGKRRNGTDLLAIEEYKHPSKVAKLVRFIEAYRAGRYDSDARGHGLHLTAREILQLADVNKRKYEKLAAQGATWQTKSGKLLPEAIFAGMYYFIEKVSDKDYAWDFFESLATSLNIQKGDPVAVLRRTLSQWKSNPRQRVRARENVLIVTVAWNAYVPYRLRSEPCERLYYRSKGMDLPGLVKVK